MAEQRTIARPYARAVFQCARDAALLPGWGEALARAAAVVCDKRVALLIGNPRVQPADLVELVFGIAAPDIAAADARLTQELRNFLTLLVHNRRLALLPQIASQFETLRADAENVAHVEVRSARALSSEQAARLKASLERRLGRAVQLHPDVDATLIGGAIVRYGDLVIDGSLRGRTERMAVAMSGA